MESLVNEVFVHVYMEIVRVDKTAEETQLRGCAGGALLTLLKRVFPTFRQASVISTRVASARCKLAPVMSAPMSTVLCSKYQICMMKSLAELSEDSV